MIHWFLIINFVVFLVYSDKRHTISLDNSSLNFLKIEVNASLFFLYALENKEIELIESVYTVMDEFEINIL